MKKKQSIKAIRLFGYDWKIVLKNEEYESHGGNFKWSTKTIEVNDKYGEANAILMHELLEAILSHNLARYYGNEGNTEYHFFFDHTQFTTIAYDLFIALNDNGLLNSITPLKKKK